MMRLVGVSGEGTEAGWRHMEGNASDVIEV